MAARSDIIHCIKCNRAISPRDWSTLNVSSISHNDGYTHNECSLNISDLIEQQDLIETASKTISKLENDHTIEKQQWNESKQLLQLEIYELKSEIKEEQQIIQQFENQINENILDHKYYKNEINKLQKQYSNDKNEWKLRELRLKQQMNAITESFSKIVLERDELRKQMIDIINCDDDIESEKCVIKFEYWLKNNVGLKQYLMAFRKAEYNDTRLISYFNKDILINEVGIYKELHINLLLNKSKQFKNDYHTFIEWLNINKLNKYKQELQFNGILTMNDLKNDIQNKQQLECVLNCNDMRELDIFMNCIFDKQRFEYFDDEKQEEKDEIISDNKLYETPMDYTDNCIEMNKLQFDLENYRFDQIEQHIKLSLKKYKTNICKKRYILDALIIFHPFKAQIFRDWESFKNQQYNNLLEKLLDGNNENGLLLFDAYSILFDLIIGCYNSMQHEYKLMEYQHPIAVNLVFLNMSLFYKVSKCFYNNMDENRNRIKNIMEFINGIIDGIINKIIKSNKCYNNNKYYVNEEMIECFKWFIVKSCEILWNVIHYKMEIHPSKMMMIENDTMKYCYFPAVVGNNNNNNNCVLQTKVWYICDAL